MDRIQQAEMAVRAVCSNDLARARVILEADRALSAENFYLACACGELEAVQRAIGRDPGIARRKGGPNAWEPLEYACFSRWLRADPQRRGRIIEVARVLLASGANANAHHIAAGTNESSKETVLFAAAGIANNAELTRMLLDAGADVNDGLQAPPAGTVSGSESLYHVCEFRDTSCLAMLLEARPHPAFVSFCLGRALDFENAAAVQLFLNHGADPNFRIPWFENRTHLHRAIENRRSPAVIAALLEAGADVHATDDRGLTPGQYAVRYGRDDVVELFAAKGACEVTDEDRLLGRVMRGERVDTTVAIPPDLLCDAARRNDTATIEALLAAGADIGAPNVGQYGSPPLHWAAWRGRLAAVQMLVEHGADIRQMNSYGGDALSTTIHGSENCFDPDGGPAMRLPEEAFPGQYVEIVDYLIGKGATLPEAIWGGSETVREALRRHGVPDPDEGTA